MFQGRNREGLITAAPQQIPSLPPGFDTLKKTFSQETVWKNIREGTKFKGQKEVPKSAEKSHIERGEGMKAALLGVLQREAAASV